MSLDVLCISIVLTVRQNFHDKSMFGDDAHPVIVAIVRSMSALKAWHATQAAQLTRPDIERNAVIGTAMQVDVMNPHQSHTTLSTPASCILLTIP